MPVTDDRFDVPNMEPLGFLIANHPTETPPKPLAKFRPHEAVHGFAFSPSATWGSETTAYVALFGDFSPATGTVSAGGLEHPSDVTGPTGTCTSPTGASPE